MQTTSPGTSQADGSAELSIDGFRVAVTADRRAIDQIRMIEAHGATTLHAPVIRTETFSPHQIFAGALDDLDASRLDVAVFTTGVGCRAMFDAADTLGRGDVLRNKLDGCVIVARSPKAQAAAVANGLEVQWVAASEEASEVAGYVAAHHAGKRVAVQLDGTLDDEAWRWLGDAGCQVFGVPVYECRLPEDPGPAREMLAQIGQGLVDAVTFTSAPAVRNAFELASDPGELRVALNGDVTAVCVGPVCAKALFESGVETMVVPERARLGPMVNALAGALAGCSREVAIAGTTGQLRGHSFAADGHGVSILSPRELAVFVALCDRSPAVVSKKALAREVWGPDADTHSVEVTVGRLRERLGSLGKAIITVPRRGYRLDTAST